MAERRANRPAPRRPLHADEDVGEQPRRKRNLLVAQLGEQSSALADNGRVLLGSAGTLRRARPSPIAGVGLAIQDRRELAGDFFAADRTAEWRLDDRGVSRRSHDAPRSSRPSSTATRLCRGAASLRASRNKRRARWRRTFDADREMPRLARSLRARARTRRGARPGPARCHSVGRAPQRDAPSRQPG